MRWFRRTLTRILPAMDNSDIPPVIVSGLAITFPFVKVYNGGMLEVLGYDTFFLHGLEDVNQFLGEDRSS